MRQLEIGPGSYPLAGFIAVDVVPRPGVACLADARALPFAAGSFELIYTSHVIEHVAWFDTHVMLGECRRVLRRGGAIEVWTVDALKIAQELVNLEAGGPSPIRRDGWRRFNPEGDPYKWIAGRTYAYGSSAGDPNWHKALFTARSLAAALVRAGFRRVRRLVKPRGYDHRWINMGMGATC